MWGVQELYTSMESKKYNLNDYLLWRGDIPISSQNLNEIDALALTQISYMNFASAFADKNELSISEATKYLDEKNYIHDQFQHKRYNYFVEMSKHIRFKDLILHDYVSILDKHKSLQFAAISITIDKNLEFISIRGTDLSIIGWKEDLNLSYSTPVPAQIEAKKYINNISKGLKKQLIIAGHSKGGNLAVYAATFAYKTVKRKLKCVFSFDGPGFENDVINSSQYKEISDRIYVYVPKNTLVGALMYNANFQKVVDSSAFGILQHDAFSWCLLGNCFIETSRCESSIKFGGEVDNWLNRYDRNQREKLINYLFSILEKTGAETIKDINFNTLMLTTLFETINELDSKQKESIISIVKMLVSYGAESVTEQIKEKTIIGKIFNKDKTE